MIVGIYAAGVPVIPVDADSVVTHRLDMLHLRSSLVHLKRRGLIGAREVGLLGFGAMRPCAYCARTFIPQKSNPVARVVTVFPVDLDSFRFGNGDMFGVDLNGWHHTLSISLTPGMRRMLPVTFSS